MQGLLPRENVRSDSGIKKGQEGIKAFGGPMQRLMPHDSDLMPLIDLSRDGTHV